MTCVVASILYIATFFVAPRKRKDIRPECLDFGEHILETNPKAQTPLNSTFTL